MRRIVLFAVAVAMAGCGRSGGLRTNNTKPTGDAAAVGTGGMGAGGSPGASEGAAGGGISIAGSTAPSSTTADAATASGGGVSTGGSTGSSGGAGGRTTGSGGIASSGGRVDASGGQSGGSSGAGGGGSASGGSTGGSGGQSGGSSGTGGGGFASGGSAGGSGGRSGGSSGTGSGGSASGGSGGPGGSSTGTTGGAAAGSGGSTGGAAGNGGTSGTGGSAGSCTGCQSLEQCWNGQLCVAKSVSVPAGFSIDATEVTRGQYAAWLATNPATTGQAAVCSWNTSFTPNATCMAQPSVCQGTECANHPQPCIDMCDASAYCNAVGKRLCGAIGGGSVSSTAPDLSLNIATKSQWYNACSSNGVNQFTYGNSSVRGNCNDYLTFSTTTGPVASMPECQSPIPGYAGVFDLIGNVSEWEDNCYGSAGQADGCRARGFSFRLSELMPMCSQFSSTYRSAAYDNVGFRCCVP